MWCWSSGVAWIIVDGVRAHRLAEAGLHRGDETGLVVAQPQARPEREGRPGRRPTGLTRPRRAEVRQAQPGRRPGADRGDRALPGRDVDVRRRRRRDRERVRRDPRAAHVADERPAAGLVEVADVVGGVAGRVLDPEGAFDVTLAAGQHAQVGLRHRDHLAPQRAQALLSPVQAPRARDELRRVDHVRCPALVDVDREVRPAAHQRARRAGVVEVDVRQQQRARLQAVQRRQQRVLADARARVDQDPVDLPAADHLLVPLVLHVDRPHRIDPRDHRRLRRVAARSWRPA